MKNRLSRLACNAKFCINKLNILSIFDTEKYKFSLVIGTLFIIGGVFVAKEFNAHSTTILAESIGFGLHALGMMPFIALITKKRESITDELVRFYRRGYFITEKFSETQCTVKGWEAYRYKITVEAGNRLDESGFLIDHNELHKCITEWVEENTMLSCEQTIQALCYTIGQKCISYKVDLKRLGFEIAPVDREDLVYGSDGELIAKNVEAAQSMPAGAEYWCTFNK